MNLKNNLVGIVCSILGVCVFCAWGGVQLNKQTGAEIGYREPSSVFAPLVNKFGLDKYVADVPTEKWTAEDSSDMFVKKNNTTNSSGFETPKAEEPQPETIVVTEDIINTLAGKINTDVKYIDYTYTSSPNVSKNEQTKKCVYSHVREKNLDKYHLDYIIPMSYISQYSNLSEDAYTRYMEDENSHVTVLVDKADEMPSKWVPDYNTGNYCYTFLYLADKYGIPVPKEDVEACRVHCIQAIKSGKELKLISQAE